jgi:hypothetical protein
MIFNKLLPPSPGPAEGASTPEQESLDTLYQARLVLEQQILKGLGPRYNIAMLRMGLLHGTLIAAMEKVQALRGGPVTLARIPPQVEKGPVRRLWRGMEMGRTEYLLPSRGWVGPYLLIVVLYDLIEDCLYSGITGMEPVALFGLEGIKEKGVRPGEYSRVGPRIGGYLTGGGYYAGRISAGEASLLTWLLAAAPKALEALK